MKKITVTIPLTLPKSICISAQKEAAARGDSLDKLISDELEKFLPRNIAKTKNAISKSYNCNVRYKNQRRVA